MTEEDVTEEMGHVYGHLIGLAGQLTAEQFRAVLTGMLANLAGLMPEKDWQKFKTIAPCEVKGCNCHLTTMPTVVKLFENLREEHHKVMEEMGKGFAE